MVYIDILVRLVFVLFCFFGGARDQTQGLTHARQIRLHF